ncbi:hypothetical protein Tco_1285680 [Tanacetum coccineum]
MNFHSLSTNKLDLANCSQEESTGTLKMQWKHTSWNWKPKEETFQVVLDALALIPFAILQFYTADVPGVYMLSILELHIQGMRLLRFNLTRRKIQTSLRSLQLYLSDFAQVYLSRDFDALPLKKDTYASTLEKCCCSYQKEAYLDKDCGFVKLQMKKSKAYKTYLGYATGAVSPKVARKFKKASPSKKESFGHSGKSLRSDTKFKGKEKEKVDVAHDKGIELLSEVALTEKGSVEEVRKKSLRDFHKTHPSGSGTFAKKPPSVENRSLLPSQVKETGDKPEFPICDEETLLRVYLSLEQDEESNDDNQEEEEFDQENESEDDEIESDEDKGMDDATDQFDDDVDARLEEPTQTGKEVVQGTKSQPKSSGKSVQSEEPVFEVADSNMPQDQEGNMGNNENEPRNKTASRSDWFKKPTPPQEPTNPDWNIGKTTQKGPT